MNQKELAQELGLSAPMVSKLAKRGMPTDDVDAARRWRKRHLEGTRMKGIRADTLAAAPQRAKPSTAAAAPAGPRVAPPRFPVPPDLANLDWAAPDLELRIAQRLALLADSNFDENVQALRLFMVLIPRADRSRLMMPFRVWERLFPAGVLEVIAPGYDPALGPQSTKSAGHVADKLSEESLHVLFELQCGLRQFRAGG